jgi:hypothetical protein
MLKNWLLLIYHHVNPRETSHVKYLQPYQYDLFQKTDVDKISPCESKTKHSLWSITATSSGFVQQTGCCGNINI